MAPWWQLLAVVRMAELRPGSQVQRADCFSPQRCWGAGGPEQAGAGVLVLQVTPSPSSLLPPPTPPASLSGVLEIFPSASAISCTLSPPSPGSGCPCGEGTCSQSS